jgi:glutamyl-tRNA reductase
MSVLLVGMSHRSAPIDVLERAALDADAAIKLSHRAIETQFVSEAVVISTCNRVEVYVEAERFHGAVEEVSRLFAEHASLDRESLVRHLYVHFDDAAVAHLFNVAAGMDSMVTGESQILGQVRRSLQVAQAEGTVGSALHALFQQALRIGKRGHAETGIDRLAPSVVNAALDLAGGGAERQSDSRQRAPQSPTRYLVAGAGTMATLSVRTLIERGVPADRITVANRTHQRAHELVATFGVGALRWESLDLELAAADVLISCTGAAGVVFDRARIERAIDRNRPMTIIDLALPRDVAHDVDGLPGVTLIDLQALGSQDVDPELAEDIAHVREIVEGEVASFLAAKSASGVTPTVVALRSMATDVVAAELGRLETRLAGRVPEADLNEVHSALRRVAEKLIHAPTVRVQELIDGPGVLTYADALADLFALDQAAVDAVTNVGGDAS